MLQTFLITALQTSPPFNAYLLDEDFLEYLLNLIIISLSLALRGTAFSVAALAAFDSRSVGFDYRPGKFPKLRAICTNVFLN